MCDFDLETRLKFKLHRRAAWTDQKRRIDREYRRKKRIVDLAN